jgi:hypothetical protein
MQKDMNELRAVLCGQAEQVAAHFDVRLDYSDKSVKDVERILGEVHEEYRRTKDERGLRGVALQFGAYLVSIIERHHGSIDWKRDDPTIGADSFPLHWNGSVIFPYGWCMKRIFDGPADDIVSKWKVFVLKEPSK